jgi:hypothetical protein
VRITADDAAARDPHARRGGVAPVRITMTHVVAVEDRHRLTAGTGLAALGLDALASCAYGPESIVLALAVASTAGIGFTLPVSW